ncbi:hypothetical protein [Kribbella sp. NPDC055071]
MTDPLLRLYPAGYRAAHGREILDVHRELTTDLPRIGRLLADVDLIAHALRVRLGLDSASTAGRFFALAAPFALAATASYGGIHLMRWYAGVAISPGPTWSQLITIDAPQALNVLFLAMAAVGASMALIRWWRQGMVVAVIGLLGFAVEWTAKPALYDDGPFQAIAAVLTAAVLVAGPPDRRGDRKVVAGAMAAIAWFPAALVLTRGFVVSTDYGTWPLLVAAVTGCVLALRERAALVAVAVAVASPLLLAHALTNGWFAIVR